MCGRFSLYVSPKILEEHYDAEFQGLENYKPSYNAAPSQDLPVILDEDPRSIQFVDWGLHPSWFKQAKGLINLRSDTMVKKPFMRKYLSKRCLVPATGFYEWKAGEGKTKTPFHIFLKDRKIFSFAGVWEQEKDKEGNLVNHFSIITTEPNELMSKIHNRMPVILTQEQEKIWLQDDLDNEHALQLLNPYPTEEMDAYAISTKVNSPKNNNAEIINPLQTNF
jgi:putative SOS response-associated peptidase YedK